MSRNIELSDDEFYHIYNRGTEKRTIFTRKSDYERFIALLYACNGTESVRLDNNGIIQQGRTLLDYALKQKRGDPLVDICAYCIMPNHFHLLLRQRTEGGISKFMQKLVTGYTMYFNKRNDRSGVLFQGKYKAAHADTDRYLKYLIAYIHLNPVSLVDRDWRTKRTMSSQDMEKHLRSYAYSSYSDYVNDARPETQLLNQSALPVYFETPEDFRRDMNEWITFADTV